MLLPRLRPFLLFASLFLGITPVPAAEQPAGGFADAPGKEVFQSKCFQCHGDGMWKDLKQDRRRWEGVLYRMVGRGALWTEDEINTMAGYLATAFGSQGEKSANK
jgi:mono/diheme cytochrome c family protein